jgi:hypothetical protein
MSEFEYSTFVLGRCLTPAAKYSKVNGDIDDENSKPFWRRSKPRLSILTTAKSKLEKQYNKTDLQYGNEVDQVKYWVDRLAKHAAIELLATGKVSADTMEDMTCLGNDYFIETVRKATVIASQLNHEVKGAEESVQQDDVVPLNMM